MCVKANKQVKKHMSCVFFMGEQARKHKPEADRQVVGRKLCVKAYKQVKKHMSCVFSWESKRENTNRKLVDR